MIYGIFGISRTLCPTTLTASGAAAADNEGAACSLGGNTDDDSNAGKFHCDLTY
ncbi:hypothetical protein ANANG_G00258700, partial [Anguilla anguilla]